MNHRDTPTWIEHPAGRYNKTIARVETEEFLANPIAFAQNVDRLFAVGCLQDLLCRDTPIQLDDIGEEWERLLDCAISEGNTEAARDIFIRYTEFQTHVASQARELGVAIGAVLEQMRGGLVEVVDQINRGISDSDCRERNDQQEVRRKYGYFFTEAMRKQYADANLEKDGDAAEAA